jgi:hypothetical protein
VSYDEQDTNPQLGGAVGGDPIMASGRPIKPGMKVTRLTVLYASGVGHTYLLLPEDTLYDFRVKPEDADPATWTPEPTLLIVYATEEGGHLLQDAQQINLQHVASYRSMTYVQPEPKVMPAPPPQMTFRDRQRSAPSTRLVDPRKGPPVKT